MGITKFEAKLKIISSVSPEQCLTKDWDGFDHCSGGEKYPIRPSYEKFHSVVFNGVGIFFDTAVATPAMKLRV